MKEDECRNSRTERRNRINKHTQYEGDLEAKNLRTTTGISEVRLTNRI